MISLDLQQQHWCGGGGGGGGGVGWWSWLVCFIWWALLLAHPWVSEGCVVEERRTLLQLRDSLSQPNPVNESDWLWVGSDCCRWQGVLCRRRQPHRVVGIDLYFRRPQELGGWSLNASLLAPFLHLEELTLVGNQLSELLSPEGIFGLKNLKNLYLGDNLLTDKSISWIFNHTSLTSVDLSYNELQDSSILKGFCNQEKLVYIRLDGNMIKGDIDPCLSSMQALQYLSITENLFSGSIPSLSNLTSIEFLIMEENQFTGVFSFASLANLTNLQGVNLNNNYQLELETEHPTWTPSFQLSGLALDNCIINKRSGNRIPSFISTQNSIYTMSMKHTSIKGRIPPWLLSSVELGLYMRGNSLEGPLPEPPYNKTFGLTLIELSDNNISGLLPKNMSTLFPNLNFLNLSRNAFQGSIAPFSGLGFISVLDLSYNNLYGEIPHEFTRNGSRLFHLSLSSNNLEGNMLPKDSNMSRLSHLGLENNRITGSISMNLSNSPLLRTLDLGGNYMSGSIPSMLFSLPQLAALLLSGNLFHGHVATELCRMQSLRILDLSNNSFSGTIPRCLNNITSWRNMSFSFIYDNMWVAESVSVGFLTKGRSNLYKGMPLSLVTGIDLSGNQLTGDIPVEMGQLGALQSLNLSHNLLGGSIPESFRNMENIESLDLSHNQLVGNIPPQMVQLHYLSAFSVAYNNLSGIVPVGSQFSTFNKSSFEGNPGLCGLVIEVSCPLSNGTKQLYQGDAGDQEHASIMDSTLIYYMFVAASFATGFWCFVGTLALNKNLKIKYLLMVDEWTDPLVESVYQLRSYLKSYFKW